MVLPVDTVLLHVISIFRILLHTLVLLSTINYAEMAETRIAPLGAARVDRNTVLW